GVNNPAMQNVKKVGPIPRGEYEIGRQRTHQSYRGGPLPASIDLTPAKGTEVHGRTNFLIHGDNRLGNRSASQGCIIFPRNVRNEIADSGDNCLRVVP
ncbi:MAG: tlde1 domain-containing protein, partial [Arenimonas sp.]